MTKEEIFNIERTKYNYFMTDSKKFLNKTALNYVIPIEKGEVPEDDVDLNRKYISVKISKHELIKKINQTADALVAYGVKKGDIITICSSNTPETIYIDYALNKIGAIPNYIYPNSTVESIKYFLNEVDSEFLFYLNEPEIERNVMEGIKGTKVKKIISTSVLEPFPEIFKAIAKKGNREKNVRVVDGNREIITWKKLMDIGLKNKGIAKENPYEKNAICSLVHTSGTSSIPKAVMESNENINAIVKNYYISGQKFEPGKSYLQVLPVFVEFGRITTHTSLCNGVEVIIIPEMNPKNFPGLVQKYRPNYTTVTPSHWGALLKSKKFDKEDLSFFELVGSGGDGFANVEDRINSFLRQHNCELKVIDGYGSTEVTACALTNLNHARKSGSLGKPLGNTEIGIFDPDTGEKLKIGEIGEIAITGPTVTLGYYKDEDETNKVYKKHDDGKIWVHMGDLGLVDEENYGFYKGRIKNVIARKSFKFSPVEIEKAIETLPIVEKCRVVPMVDEKEGQVPSAHIVLNNYDNIEETLTKIIDVVNNTIEEFHRPTTYKIRQSIPLTKNNKTNINALRIEDIASIIPGVVFSNITPIKDEFYDYDLYIEFNPNLCLNNYSSEEDIINFIENTMKSENILGNKIRYKINFVDKKFVDSNVKKVKGCVKVL